MKGRVFYEDGISGCCTRVDGKLVNHEAAQSKLLHKHQHHKQVFCVFSGRGKRCITRGSRKPQQKQLTMYDQGQQKTTTKAAYDV
jgi:mannose-6-phosphate isomerase-like protein (cupin superfamily)